MKAGTPETLKFKKLQRRLEESVRGTVGLLDYMWQRVAKECPAGDIGRFSNEEIALLCDWQGDPELLVESLVECGWVDKNLEHRLVVHDWHEHCPNYLKGAFAKNGKQFASQNARQNACEGAKQVPGSLPVPPPPIRTVPNLSNNGRNVADGRLVFGGEEFEQTRERLEQVKNTVELSPDKPLKPDDRLLCIQAVVLEHYGLLELGPILNSCRSGNQINGTRWGYFKGCVIKNCKQAGFELSDAENWMDIAPELLEPPKPPP